MAVFKKILSVALAVAVLLLAGYAVFGLTRFGGGYGLGDLLGRRYSSEDASLRLRLEEDRPFAVFVGGEFLPVEGISCEDSLLRLSCDSGGLSFGVADPSTLFCLELGVWVYG